MNWKRIMILLKKDIHENWAVSLLIISIPLLIYFIPQFMTSEEIMVGVCGELPSDFPFKANYYSVEEGIRAVEQGDITAFYVPSQNLLYGDRTLKEQVEMVAWLLSPTGMIIETPVNSIDPTYLMLPLLLSFVIFMGGIIGAPIVIGSEKSNGTLEALILTPLTYTEFVVEKSFFGFISIFLSSIIFLIISRAFLGNILGTLLILALGTLLFSLIAVLMTTPFSAMESLMAVATPALIIILFFESISMLNSYSFPLPISTGIYKSMILDQFPSREILVLSIFIILSVYINSKILRRILHNGR